MSLTRIHNLSISLDGFATGEHSPPMHPSAMRASACTVYSGTRFGTQAEAPESTTPFQRLITASAPRSWAPTSSARPAGATTRTGRAGGAPTRRSAHRPCSPPARGPRSRWRAACVSTSSTPPQRGARTARKAADGRDVRIGGGPSVVRDFLAAELVDHMHLVQVPIVLGRGVPSGTVWKALEDAYDVEAVSSPGSPTSRSAEGRLVTIDTWGKISVFLRAGAPRQPGTSVLLRERCDVLAGRITVIRPYQCGGSVAVFSHVSRGEPGSTSSTSVPRPTSTARCWGESGARDARTRTRHG